MHKKDQVKHVIETYIKKGWDFYELTPSFLQNTDELKGFSERTLKRGRTEFKSERADLMKKQSKGTASAHKRVYKYLDATPETTTRQLADKFPDIDTKELAGARKLWQMENKTDKDQVRSGSLRKQVFDFLDKNPAADLAALEQVFPEARRSTINNYRETWRREQKPQRKISLKQRITDFMNENPQADLKQLKAAFTDTKPGSLNTYFSLWKNNRFQQPVAKKQKAEKPLRIGKNDSDIIQALKTTIEAQKKTIEVLKSQNEILRERQNIGFPELEGMTHDEIVTVERVIRTFIRGIRNP